MFRADIEWVVPTAEESKKSKARRKPIDALVLLRMLVLQSLYNLSDDQIETCRIDKTAIVNLRCVPRGTPAPSVQTNAVPARQAETSISRHVAISTA